VFSTAHLELCSSQVLRRPGGSLAFLLVLLTALYVEKASASCCELTRVPAEPRADVRACEPDGYGGCGSVFWEAPLAPGQSIEVCTSGELVVYLDRTRPPIPGSRRPPPRATGPKSISSTSLRRRFGPPYLCSDPTCVEIRKGDFFIISAAVRASGALPSRCPSCQGRQERRHSMRPIRCARSTLLSNRNTCLSERRARPML